MTIWDDLAAEFPRAAISWRAQSLTKNGDKAMALAYLDSRDIRRRLNEVVGPANWQNEFRDCGDGKLACRLSVRVDGEWISKEDGAGATQVEAEKGAFSSALKRAAVAFGIGEYLYDLPTVWVPCETWEDKSGKKHWQKWLGDPWDFVRGQSSAQRKPVAAESNNPAPEQPKGFNGHLSAITAAKDMDTLKRAWVTVAKDDDLTKQERDDLEAGKDQRKAELSYVPPSFGDLPPETQDAVKNLGA